MRVNKPSGAWTSTETFEQVESEEEEEEEDPVRDTSGIIAARSIPILF